MRKTLMMTETLRDMLTRAVTDAFDVSTSVDTRGPVRRVYVSEPKNCVRVHFSTENCLSVCIAFSVFEEDDTAEVYMNVPFVDEMKYTSSKLSEFFESSESAAKLASSDYTVELNDNSVSLSKTIPCPWSRNVGEFHEMKFVATCCQMFVELANIADELYPEICRRIFSSLT